MEKRKSVWGIRAFLLAVCLFAAGLLLPSGTVDAQAAAKGFRTVKGKTYYYKNGKKVKGWLTVGGKKYYLNKKTGVLKKGWMTSGGKKRYFDSKTGVMATGLKKVGKYSYYFDKQTGAAQTGFITSSNGNTRYFRKKDYRMATGWLKNSEGRKRYFKSSSGVMYKGRKKVGKNYYYFDKESGLTKSGWVTESGVKRYYDTKTYVMATGTKTIGGIKYTFRSDGTVKKQEKDKWEALLEKYRKDASVKQLIFVQYTGGTKADVIMYTRSGTGDFKKKLTCQGYVGRKGIDKKKEGDGKTPTGEFGFTMAFGIAGNPGTKISYTKLDKYMYWCADKYYNQFVSVKAGEKPHKCKGEHLIDYNPQYKYVLALDYNSGNIKGKGSAIFLHCSGKYGYTGGCVSVSQSNMKKIIRTVDQNAKICIYKK